MCLDEWLNYIETRYKRKVELGLERVSVVAKELNLTSFPCPVITVAGTNGKGSCVAYLETIWLKAGYKVGAYTSPHLLNFNERIRINGKDIDDQSLCEAFEIIDAFNCSLTYFEFITLAALYIFKSTDLDVLLLEVGLGGRLDAVNVVHNDVAVITSVAIDHVAYLGDTREKIGLEKAGIMRRGKIAVCGDPSPPQSLIKHAENLGVDLYFSPNNRLTVSMVIKLLESRLPVSDDIIREGLARAFVPGRFQCFNDPSTIILDVAHNPAAADFLAGQLAKKYCVGKTLAVVGMLKDKDIAGTLQPMLNLVDEWYVADLCVERGAKGKILWQYLQEFGQKACYTYKSVTEAYLKAVANCGKKDRIIIFGSFYTVGEVLKRRIESGFTS
jgi:dihydrofolate synthase/folylpolyglutamate synthase